MDTAQPNLFGEVDDRPTIFTVGHSTRPFEELIDLLRAHRVKTLADVRAFPRSRRHPHFNLEHLADRLPEFGLGYVHLPGLGGRRRPAPDSTNTAWRNESFRAYADYMQTGEFASALAELENIARVSPTAIMCAEGPPWRCHRSLIADALVARGWRVLDITSPRRAATHKLPDFARLDGSKVTYPGTAD